MNAADRFLAAARERGVEVTVTQYPEGTRTAADAATAVGCDVGQIVKSLVFVADDEPVLALTSGRNRVDVDALATAVGAADVRQAKADEVKQATGYAIGGTPPFGHAQPISTVLDEDLLDHETVWAAAGTPDRCFPIAPGDLQATTGATVAAIAES